MMQYGIHKGIKDFFGNSGTTAVLEEPHQLHGRGVIEPCDSNELSQDKKVGAFE